MKKIHFVMTIFISVFAISLVFVNISGAAVDLKNAFVIWTFSEGTGTTVKDMSGNGNDGKFQKDVKWVDGKSGKGVQLDGKTTAVVSSTVKGVGKTAVSECLWVKFSDLTPENMFGYISCTGTSNARYFYYSTWSSAGAPNDAVHCGTLDTKGAWGRGIATGRIFKKDIWYFIAGVIDTKAGLIRVYVDGKMPGDGELKIDAGDIPGTPKEIWAGSSPENYAFVAGTIDDVAFFNVALSAADVSEIMTKGLGSTTPVQAGGKVATEWGNIKTQ
ncbi:MAG: LamG protein [Candidatus Poribacteria bacterium]|nr:LamG protein [Candidatus Poribacteria bacterium]MDQ1328870.1 LamG protein [Candidatus Poribacteria bacterium]